MEAEKEGEEDPHVVVSATFVVNTLATKVLFDAGVMHSFVNPTTITQMACVLKELDVQLCVTTPMGSIYLADYLE